MKLNSLIIFAILISASYQVVQDKIKQQDLSPNTHASDLIFTGIKANAKQPDTDAEIMERREGGAGFPMVMELPAKDLDLHMAWVEFYREMNSEETVDYMAIESILKEPKFDSKSKATLLPYSALYKFGQGFNLEDASGRASPFVADILYNSEPDSLEGTDGKISQKIYTSAKDFALDISASLAVKYAGFGIKAAASLSMDASYSIATDEVVLRSTHSIDGGKSIFSQDKLKLTKEAKYTLATDQQKFRNAYGTHFIVGFTVQCDMDIYYRRKVTDQNQKYEVGLKMSAENSFVDVAGSLDVGLSMKDKMDKTSVEVKYTGTDGSKFIEGLNLQQLQQAILEFPDICDSGNVRDYILWPYQQVNAYQKVISNIALAQTMTEIERNNQEVEEVTEVDVLEEVTDAVDVLDKLYTTAILEVKIIQNSMEKEKTYTISQSDKKKDRIFELDLYEMILFDQYEKHKTILESSTDRIQDIRLLRQAKLMIDSGRIVVLGENSEQGNSEILNAMELYYDRQGEIETGDFECNVQNCKTCSMLSANACSVCEAEFELTNDGGCSGWIVIFKQSSGTYNTANDWLNINDEEKGDFEDNYSILHRIDDSYQNENSQYEFRMSWPHDLDPVYDMQWYQTSTPWTDSSISGYESIQNIGFGETFKGLRKNGEDALISANIFMGMLSGGFHEGYFQAGTFNDVDGGIPGPVNKVKSNAGCSSTSRCYSCQGSCLFDSDCQQGLKCQLPQDSWSTLQGGSDFRDIAVEPSGVLWALKTDDTIWKKETSESSWEKIDGGLARISAGPDGAWGVNSAHNIFYWSYDSNNWNQVDGGLSDIGTGADGSVWGVNSSDDIYKHISGNEWKQSPGKLIAISVNSNGNKPWGINSGKAIYEYNGSDWKFIASDNDGTDIEVGKDDSVWYWTASGQLKKRTNDSWTKVQQAPRVQDVAVLSEDEYYVVDLQGSVQKFTGAVMCSELSLSGCHGDQKSCSGYCQNPDIESTSVSQVVIEVKTY